MRVAWENSHDRDSIIVKDCGYIFRGELVGGVGYQKTRLADRTVTNDDTPIDHLVSTFLHMTVPIS